MNKFHQKPQKGAKLFPPMAIIFFHDGGPKAVRVEVSKRGRGEGGAPSLFCHA